MNNTSLIDHVPPPDPHPITTGLTDMYNLGLDHAVEAIKTIITDQVEAIALINALQTLKQ